MTDKFTHEDAMYALDQARDGLIAASQALRTVYRLTGKRPAADLGAAMLDAMEAVSSMQVEETKQWENTVASWKDTKKYLTIVESAEVGLQKAAQLRAAFSAAPQPAKGDK